ncbi:hypothetical protein FOA52_007307 [Chlamydomonas sp. UWO 241]|nr:hypothetical protein FOA52_007307 [Chlamydomonas sp. UWO 241]
MTQTAGPQTGFLVNPQTMHSFVGSAAMESTLDVIAGLVRYSAIGSTCNLLSPAMMNGTCAETIVAATLFKLVQKLSPFKGVIGVARLPGSTRVLDRQNSRLEECTSGLCPYAQLQRTYDGHNVLVNHSPYYGFSGFTGYINAKQDPVYQQATYAFYSFILEPTYSKQRVITQLLTGPFRTSHLDTSVASLQEWESAGFDPGAVKELLQTIQSDMEAPNFVMKLRIRGGQSFLAALAPAVVNVTRGMAPAAVASNLAAIYDAILVESGPIDVVCESLWHGLGIEPPLPPPRIEPPSPQPPTPPGTANTGGATAATAGGGSNLGIIVGVTISVIVVLLSVLVVLFLLMRHFNRWPFGQLGMPRAGDDTTLCVTDIMDSTALWETLDAGGMSRAVATHHYIVRKALSRFHGYEQATEGDSFLLAFHTPSDALGFAVHLQAGLLSADWDPELLTHPSCAPVAMVPSDALIDAGGGDGRFHLCATARLLLGSSENTRWRRGSSGVGLEGSHGSFLHSSGGGHGLSFLRISSYMASMLSPIASTPAGAMGTASADGAAAVQAGFGSSASVAPPGGGVVAANAMLDGTLDSMLDKEVGPPADGPSNRVSCVPTREPEDHPHAPSMLSRLSGRASASGSQQPRQGAPPAVETRDQLPTLSMLSRRGSMVHYSTNTLVSSLHPGDVAETIDAASRFELEHTLVFLRNVVRAVAAAAQSAPAARDTAVYTMADFMRQAFSRTPPKDQTAMTGQTAMMFKGLRVRVGMHSGVSKTDVERNSTAGEASPAAMTPFLHRCAACSCQGCRRCRALSVFTALSTRLLHQVGGYLVELTSSGMCLAAFGEPASAVAWGLCLIKVMKHAEWDKELLGHKLCEEVLVHAPGTGGPFPENDAERVLFRGPRLKVGIDEGMVQADVSPVTGRMTYRGRVMNRAARICGKASCGMQWCSVAAWEHASKKVLDQLPSLGIVGTELGAFELKGISSAEQLVQCALGGSPVLLAPVHSVARTSRAANSLSTHAEALSAFASAEGVDEFPDAQEQAQAQMQMRAQAQAWAPGSPAAAVRAHVAVVPSRLLACDSHNRGHGCSAALGAAHRPLVEAPAHSHLGALISDLSFDAGVLADALGCSAAMLPTPPLGLLRVGAGARLNSLEPFGSPSSLCRDGALGTL